MSKGGFFSDLLSGVGSFVQKTDMQLHGITPHANVKANKAINTLGKYANPVIDAPFGGAGVTEHLQKVANGEAQYRTRDYVRMGLGTYAAANMAGRVVSGGGVYRDSQGNFDVAGIPIL